MKVGVVVIDYFSFERTVQYIKDFYENVNIQTSEIDFVVVDNSCDSDNSMKLVENIKETMNVEFQTIADERFCGWESVGSIHISLLSSPINGGFAKGNNLGAKYIRNHSGADYILFSNNDIIFEQECNLALMMMDFEKNPKVGIWGPNVIGLDGKKQSPQRFMSIWERWIVPEFVWPLNYHVPFLKKVGNPKELIDSDIPCVVYRVIGAFMAVRASAFFDVGMFDENTFLYAEELILSERFAIAGYLAWYNPSICIVHEGGYTTKESKLLCDFKAIDRRFDSEIYYFRKYRDCGIVAIQIAKINYFLYKCKTKLHNYIKKRLICNLVI